MTRVRAPTTGRLASHQARLFIPRPDPHGTGSLIRDASGERNRGPKRQRVHVHAAHHIPVADKRALGIAAAPDAPLHFVFPAAYRTLAARSPLTASEALDAGCFGFGSKIGQIPAVLPPAQALIMMPSAGPLAHTLRIADEQPAHLMLLTKRDDFAGSLMAQRPNLPPGARAHLAPSSLQLAPAPRAPRAAAALPGQLPQSHMVPPLE